MTPFPLLRLPRLALIPVFQHMEPSEIIAFSLLSNRAKNLVKMLWKPSVKTISFLVVSNDLSILAYLSNYDKPLRLRIKTKTVNGMIPLSKWLERVLDVLNSYSIFQINLHGSPQLEVCGGYRFSQWITKYPSLFEAAERKVRLTLGIFVEDKNEVVQSLFIDSCYGHINILGIS
ncbi:CRE-FBXB-17 protein [Caenorhabditis remanei]|uniref:CRE-FBXB-17 protein n=1 Tax=Caenorhabditis remanei TaxID=31234 RepID=E3N0W3_CAERE|nr:CRE-FBXB-17 protein [Caenorhabditis remanei]